MINRETPMPEGARISVQTKLSALWTALMFLYVYADLLSLYKPGQLDEAMSGRMGPFQVSQTALLTASVLMIIPALMIVLTLTLPPRASRWTNVVLGVAFTLVNIINLIGVTWLYYLLFGILEILLTLAILAYAWRWPQAAPAVETPANEGRGMRPDQRVQAVEGRGI